MSVLKGIVAVGIDHHSCSPDNIAAASLNAETLPLAYKAALGAGAEEVFILSTCNRVEVYAVADTQTAIAACHAALSLGGLRDTEILSGKTTCFTGADAIKHLFEVACGLDSQILGENEILGQIKNAYAAADKRSLAQTLNRTIQKAIQCAKWIRTNTEVGKGGTTLGAVVADLSARIFDDFSAKRILLAGSGEVGKSVAMALAARGAKNITVSSRTWEKAYKLSNEVGGSAIAFERIKNELGNFDIAIFALAEARHIIDFQTGLDAAKTRGNSPLFLLDLAVPHNINPKINELDDVFLYTLDDVTKLANENIKLREGEIEKAKIEIEKRVNYLWERLNK